MKKKIKIKVPPIDILKETSEERKERVRNSGNSMITRVVPNKRKLTTKQQRQRDSKEIKNWQQ